MMPSTAPATRLQVLTCAARMRRTGHVYLISVETASSAVATPSVTHDVTVCSTAAHTAMAPNTSTVPGSSGTTMPTRPTKMTSAATTMPPVLTVVSRAPTG